MKTYTTLLSVSLFSCFLAIPASADPASGTTVANLSDGSLNGDVLTITADITALGPGTSTAALYIGEATPRDGDPANLMRVAVTDNVVGTGTLSFTPQITVGTKIAYKVVVENDQGGDGVFTSSTETKTVTATDNFGYVYIGTGVGDWHDPANWQFDNPGNLKTVGYPAYSYNWINMGGNTIEVHLDADYSFREVHWKDANLRMTLVGDNSAAKITADGFYCGSSVITFDNVRIYGNSYTIPANGKQYLINGADLNVKWEINVNGENAYLYVGDGSIAQTKRDWWWTFRIDGQGAQVVLDNGTIYTRGLRFGANDSSAAPLGIVFKGDHPLLKIDEELVIVNSIPGSPTLEFYVPYGGYASAPVVKVGGNRQFPMAGTRWQDVDNAYPIPLTSPLGTVQFKISERSPFFTQLDTADFLLVDWSCNNDASVYIDRAGVSFAAFEDAAHNAFHYGTTVQGIDNQIWVSLTGTGEVFSRTTMASAISGAASGNNITVTGSVDEVGDGTSTATLYLGICGPNSDPRDHMAEAATVSISETGDIEFIESVPLGAQVAYCIQTVNTQGNRSFTSSSVTNVVKITDTASFTWIQGHSGNWSDADNWICNSSDGASRLGYPSYGSKCTFQGSQTITVYVDGAYTDMQWNSCLGWGGCTATFIGTVPDAEISAEGFECYDNVNLTFDGVALSKSAKIGSYGIYNNSSMRLLNGSSLSVRWSVDVNGANALLYVGSNSVVNVTKAEPYHKLGLSGENAKIVIDDGTIDALYLYIGDSKTDQTPAGIFFQGKNPQLTIRGTMGYAQGIQSALPGSPVFHFTIPVGGYAETPIRRTGAWGGGAVDLFAQASADIPDVLFEIDRKSPFFNEPTSIDQQLVDWSCDSKAGINTDGISFDNTLDSGVCSFYYTPDEAATKTGLWTHLQGHGFTLILFR